MHWLMNHISSGKVQGKLVHCGGFKWEVSVYSSHYSDQCFEYQTETDEWTFVKSMDLPRSGATLVQLDEDDFWIGGMWVAGGFLALFCNWCLLEIDHLDWTFWMLFYTSLGLSDWHSVCLWQYWLPLNWGCHYPWSFFWFGGILGSALRAKFPVALSNHSGFMPTLLYSSTHHSPESLKTENWLSSRCLTSVPGPYGAKKNGTSFTPVYCWHHLFLITIFFFKYIKLRFWDMNIFQVEQAQMEERLTWQSFTVVTSATMSLLTREWAVSTMHVLSYFRTRKSCWREDSLIMVLYWVQLVCTILTRTCGQVCQVNTLTQTNTGIYRLRRNSCAASYNSHSSVEKRPFSLKFTHNIQWSNP